VVESGEQLGLALEAGHALGVAGHQLGQHLDRHLAPELGVLGPVDLPHPAFAQFACDLEMRQCGSDHECLRSVNAAAFDL
jgi:hypothetical protein